jgi:hypothetical protein
MPLCRPRGGWMGPGMPPFLPEDELVAGCVIPGTIGLRPHPTQSLQGLRAAFRAFWQEPVAPWRAGPAESLIVLAIDGLSFAAAKTAWSSPDLLAPLTSTFPSVSGTAWITAVTGLPVEEHLVPGVVYRRPERGALYHAYLDRDLAVEEPPPARRPGQKARSWPTFFNDMGAAGIDAVALPGDMGPWPAPLKRAVLQGARGTGDEVDWQRLRFAPREMAAAVVREVEAALAGRRPGKPLFLWAYVNLDDAIHQTGYDPAVIDALRRLETAARSWQTRGHTVAAHGDHGLVPSAPSEETAAAFAAANAPELCRLPSGGAGRVLWSYPRPGREEEVRVRLEEALAGCALVVPAARLAELGLFGWNAELAARLGEICAVATGPGFPAPPAPGRRFEHGSFTATEMLTALAVWSG